MFPQKFKYLKHTETSFRFFLALYNRSFFKIDRCYIIRTIDMPQPSLKPVLSDREIKETSTLAAIIWKEHFTPLIGSAQVEYMLEKFQSERAIQQQIENGYLYFALMLGKKQIGYTGLRLDTDCLFLSKLYIQKEYRGNGFSRLMIAEAEKIAKQKIAEQKNLF